jgi:CTP:molybdopterin cytidylyltransferase MocA
MGQPKGLLDFEGRSFARRAVEALREGGCHRVLVVTRVGDAALQNEATAAGAQILENPSPGSGPITSLRLALQSLPSATSHVVWLPLDHPTVSSESIRAVVAAAQSGDAAVALPVHDGRRGHPAVFARRIFNALQDPAVEGGARTVVHRCLDSGTAILVETDDPGVLVDVDTRDDYEALRARGESR